MVCMGPAKKKYRNRGWATIMRKRNLGYSLRLKQYIYKKKKHSCESGLFRGKQHTDLDELMAVVQELPRRIFQVTGNFRWQADDKFHIIYQTFAGK